MAPTAYIESIRQRLRQERGGCLGSGKRALALVYPSPYAVGMSSLGYQTIYRLLNQLPDTQAERAFLPDTSDTTAMLLSYETQRPVGDFPVLAFSVAYELELSGFFSCLSLAGVPQRHAERREHHPWVVVGGPLTFSNPLPLGPFADVVVMGEAEALLQPMCEVLFGGGSRAAKLQALSKLPGFWVPALHGEALPPVSAACNSLLPAYSALVTPATVLSNMFLIETARGCSRGCTFCVMRRTTNGGMRLVSVEKILSLIPTYVSKVGFVGAAVSDHPRIVQLLQAVIDSGRQISLSSLRADRLTPAFVQLLVRGGYKTLTIASDGASERLRALMQKRIYEKHLLRAAHFAGDLGIAQLKNYMMIGVPGETDADLDELIAFTQEQAHIAGPRVKVSLGIAPFVAKKNTPLDHTPFVGIREAERRLNKLRRALHPQVVVRPTSARWAWVEYQLAQGGMQAGLAAQQAWRQGGSFAAWRAALTPLLPASETACRVRRTPLPHRDLVAAL